MITVATKPRTIPGTLPRAIRVLGSGTVEVAIVGSGFAGIGMASRLLAHGFHDFVVLERGADVGGTWRDNTYPGAACDVPSHLYSFSFAPNPDWSRSFSPQAEILEYLRNTAENLGVTPHVRFGSELLDATWNETLRRWELETSRGRLDARFLILAAGGLSEPSIPEIPGLADFEGAVFHSARWDDAHDLAGANVAVVGTGASAIQIVPSIQPICGHLTVYQRTPAWVIPRYDRAFSRAERYLFRHVPIARRLIRGAIYWGRETYVLGFTRQPKLMRLPQSLAELHLRRQVRDPALRAKLRPHFTIGCKRVLISNDWYPALCRPNVELVTEAISEVRARSVVASDGTERQVDTIVFCTGFHVTELPAARRVRGNHGVVLAEAWRDGMEAYKGSTVAGFPNLFILVGPNTGLGHTSMVLMIESQVAYVADALEHMWKSGAEVLEVKPEAQSAWNLRVQDRMRSTVWTRGGCASWYLDANGRNTTLWPRSTWSFRRATRRFDSGSYRTVPAHPGTGATASEGRGRPEPATTVQPKSDSALPNAQERRSPASIA
jgi:cation diffusion facilitator CzcD-associated flavoprotein CzcO